MWFPVESVKANNQIAGFAPLIERVNRVFIDKGEIMEIKVSEPVAEYFMEQCMSEVNGHMGAIPNNAVLFGLCKAHRINSKEDFAAFLVDVARELTKEQPF